MRQTYEPKDVSFVPPILRRKWIAPTSPKEVGMALILIGIATSAVSAGPVVWDTIDAVGKPTATGQRVAQAPFRSGASQRMVGVYLFKDQSNVSFAARGGRVFTDKKQIPAQMRVIWPNGRPQAARTIYNHTDYLLALPVGLIIIGFGVWTWRKRTDAFEAAMAVRPDETASS
jgi:hypothetical protein